MGIRFGLLGPLRMERDGQALPVAGPKVRTLPAVLLTAPGEAVRVDALVDLLWDGAPPRTALASLHNHVNRLRTALGPDGARLRSVPNGYLLAVEPDELDLHLDAAQAIYAEEGVEEGLAMVLLVRALSFLKDGRLGEGLAAARGSVELFRRAEGRDNPVALCTLARLHLATGDAALAEPVFRRYAEVFRRELPSVVPTTLTGLGASLAALGREQEALEALAEALGDRSAAAVALYTTATVHAGSGRTDAARDCWTRALALARRAGLAKVTDDSLDGLESLAAS